MRRHALGGGHGESGCGLGVRLGRSGWGVGIGGGGSVGGIGGAGANEEMAEGARRWEEDEMGRGEGGGQWEVGLCAWRCGS